MRILAFTDVHAHPKTLRLLAHKAKNVDFCICCGDFTSYSMEIEEVMHFFGTQFSVPLYLIHGNHESYHRLLQFSRQYSHLIPFHLKLLPLQDNFSLFGFGGGGFSFTEPVLEKAHLQLKKKLPHKAKIILVTHAPPYNTALDFLDEERGHRGCVSSRKFIDDLQPVLALSGHFHETFGVHDKIKSSFLLNPGDEGVIIEIVHGKIKLKKK
ncbi:MAG: metallophosphoesterase [Nanoarchaeota archaeon]